MATITTRIYLALFAALLSLLMVLVTYNLTSADMLRMCAGCAGH